MNEYNKAKNVMEGTHHKTIIRMEITSESENPRFILNNYIIGFNIKRISSEDAVVIGLIDDDIIVTIIASGAILDTTINEDLTIHIRTVRNEDVKDIVISKGIITQRNCTFADFFNSKNYDFRDVIFEDGDLYDSHLSDKFDPLVASIDEMSFVKEKQIVIDKYIVQQGTDIFKNINI